MKDYMRRNGSRFTTHRITEKLDDIYAVEYRRPAPVGKWRIVRRPRPGVAGKEVRDAVSTYLRIGFDCCACGSIRR